MAKKLITSKPQKKRKLVLNTLHAQKVYKRNFNTYSNAVYNIGVMLRVVHKDEEALKTEKFIDELMLSVSNDFGKERERLQAVIDEVGIEVDVEYSNPYEFDVKVGSPRARQYLNLIIAMEGLIEMIDALWIEGQIDDAQQVASSTQWRQRLMHAGRKVINLNNEIRTRLAKEDNKESDKQTDKEEVKES